MTKKKILFLSGIDFKEKSIQVIRKTPEAFAERGWEVDYVVLRDHSKGGNYFYEKPFDPEGIHVHRLAFKMPWLLNLLSIHILRTIANKFISYIGVFQLVKQAKSLMKQHKYDAIYGYEHIGVRAVSILTKRGITGTSVKISRFQGTWMSLYYQQKRYVKMLLNIDFYWAMKFRSDICIMTDDGTQGDVIMKRIQPDHPSFKFWVNGVDISYINKEKVDGFRTTFELDKKFCLLSISRLESWKKVDRSIRIVKQLVSDHPQIREKLVYLIVGDGNDKDRLEKLVSDLGINDIVNFTGAVPHADVSSYLSIADLFMSFYDLSNVGNPLLEAIRMNKIVMTLSNGDTSKWIDHGKTGFIYDPDTNYIQLASEDIFSLLKGEFPIHEMISQVSELANNKLWTWKERFNKEVQLVESKLS